MPYLKSKVWVVFYQLISNQSILVYREDQLITCETLQVCWAILRLVCCSSVELNEVTSTVVTLLENIKIEIPSRNLYLRSLDKVNLRTVVTISIRAILIA